MPLAPRKLPRSQLRALQAVADGSPFGDTIARRSRARALKQLDRAGLIVNYGVMCNLVLRLSDEGKRVLGAATLLALYVALSAFSVAGCVASGGPGTPAPTCEPACRWEAPNDECCNDEQCVITCTPLPHDAGADGPG